jgi:hypothetical protein
MTEYTYGTASSFTASPSARPFTPPPSSSIFPGALASLSSGEMSSDSMQSGRTSRGSGTQSPSLGSVPRSQRFNPIAATSRGPVTRRRRASTRQTADDFSDDDDDYAPATSTGPDTCVDDFLDALLMLIFILVLVTAARKYVVNALSPSNAGATNFGMATVV